MSFSSTLGLPPAWIIHEYHARISLHLKANSNLSTNTWYYLEFDIYFFRNQISVMWSTTVWFTIFSCYYYILYIWRYDHSRALKLYPIRADKQQICGHRKEPKGIFLRSAFGFGKADPLHRLHMKWISVLCHPCEACRSSCCAETHLKRTLVFEQCAVRCGSKNGNQEDMCLRDIRLRDFVNHSRLDNEHNCGDSYDHLYEERESSLW